MSRRYRDDLSVAARVVREGQRRRAVEAAGVASRQGQLGLLAAVAATTDDAGRFLGLDDFGGVDEDVACELLAARDRRIP